MSLAGGLTPSVCARRSTSAEDASHGRLGAWQAGPFFGSQGEGPFPQYLFFSFTTLTTTGYGNLVPDANPGQTLAVLEMLIGQLFLVTAVARVVSAWQPAPGRARSPTEPDSN